MTIFQALWITHACSLNPVNIKGTPRAIYKPCGQFLDIFDTLSLWRPFLLSEVFVIYQSIPDLLKALLSLKDLSMVVEPGLILIAGVFVIIDVRYFVGNFEKVSKFPKKARNHLFLVFVWLFLRQKNTSLCRFHILLLWVINLKYQNSIEENI